MSAGKETMSNPFQGVDEILALHSTETIDAVVVDFHKETTSE